MVTRVAFCPGPPVLVPAVSRGAAPELDELRAACRTAIRRVMTDGVRPVVLGLGDAPAVYQPTARGSLAGFGVPLEVSLGSDEPGAVVLPSSLTVGAWLLRDALGPNCGALGCAVTREPAMYALPADEELGLLVVVDGSARRSPSAPGYFDERAAAFDAQLADVLRNGKRLGLQQPDLNLGDELLASAPAVWAAAFPLLADAAYSAELLYDDAPYGVGYFVAAWT